MRKTGLQVSYLLKAFRIGYPDCCQTPVLGLGLGVDFTFAWDNNKKNTKKNQNLHLEFLKGTVGDKEQGVRDKGEQIKFKGQGSWVMG